MDNHYGVVLANNGWAIYERATNRLVEVDGIPQLGLGFGAAAKTARLLNSADDISPPSSAPRPELGRRIKRH